MLVFRRLLLAVMLAITITNPLSENSVKATVPADTPSPPRAVKPGTVVIDKSQDPPVPDAVACPVKLKAPKFGKPSTAIVITIDGEVKEGDIIFWQVLRGGTILTAENVYHIPGNTGIVLSDGKFDSPHRVSLMFGRAGVSYPVMLAEIQIGDPAPIPPPTPVDPVVPPKPVDPVVTALPIKALFLIDEATISKELSDAVNSVDMRKYMDENASKDAENRPEYRVWDDDMTDEQILVRHPKEWVEVYHQAIAARAEAGKGDNDAWMMVTNGKAGGSLSIPLPRERLYEYLKQCRAGKFDGK